jgi:hypothetical protein
MNGGRVEAVGDDGCGRAIFSLVFCLGQRISLAMLTNIREGGN